MAKRSSGPTTFGSGLRLGVFSVITVLALVMLTDALGGISLPGQSSYTAVFSDATGVLPGDEVRIAGAKVGEIDDVGLKQGDGEPAAAITFSMEDERELPESVHATIKYRNLVGQRYLALTPAAEGEKPSDKSLQPGDTIGQRQTTPALDLTVLLNGFKPLFAALSADEVNKLSYEIIRTLQGEAPAIEGLLAHTASLTTTLAAHDDTIGEVIDNLNDILKTVGERDKELDDSIGRLQDFVSGLSDDRDALGDAVVSIGDLTTQTSALVSDARPALDDDVESLRDLSATLNANSEEIETSLERLPNTFDSLTTTASYGSWFNFFLCDFGGKIGLSESVTLEPVEVHSPRERCQGGGE